MSKLIEETRSFLIEESSQEFNKKYTNEKFDKYYSSLEDIMSKGYFKTKTELSNAKSIISYMIDAVRDGLPRDIIYSGNPDIAEGVNFYDIAGITSKRMKLLRDNGLESLAELFEKIKELSIEIKNYPVGAENKKETGNIDSKYKKFYDVINKDISAVEKDDLLNELLSIWDDIVSKAAKSNPRKPAGREQTMGWRSVNILPEKPTTFTEMTSIAWKTAGLYQEIKDAEIVKDLYSVINKKKPTSVTSEGSVTKVDKVIQWIANRLNESVPEIVEADTSKIIKQVAKYKEYAKQREVLENKLINDYIKNASEEDLKGVSYHDREKVEVETYIEWVTPYIKDDAQLKTQFDRNEPGANYSWGRKEKKVSESYKNFLDEYNKKMNALKDSFGLMMGIGMFVKMSEAEIKKYVEKDIQDKIDSQITSAIKKIKQRNIVDVVDGEFNSRLSIFSDHGFHWTVSDDKGESYDLHFRAIWAGGYNIQIGHVRSIITIKKN